MKELPPYCTNCEFKVKAVKPAKFPKNGDFVQDVCLLEEQAKLNKGVVKCPRIEVDEDKLLGS